MALQDSLADLAQMDRFIARWQKAGGTERANYQMFFAELCDALGVQRPNPRHQTHQSEIYAWG
ncbi:MAG: hypothetical protein HC860_10485 [Alkalinema sp. RU_4_3]|nr:hypothetical protein [Alkalinema sp. RU_4_3]